MSYIKKEIIDRIYEDGDLMNTIQSKVQLKKNGANYVGLSPFVEEKTPSFVVSPSKGIWKDFSTGKGGNNAVSFVQALGFEWIDAVKLVAEMSNIVIEYEEDSPKTKEYTEKLEKKVKLSQLTQAVVNKYHKAFLELPKEHPAKVEIYQKRKYTDKIVEEYQIGYAPGEKFIYDNCVATANVDIAREIGLISESKNHDFWVNRVIFPFITDSRKYPVIGMAGRKLSEDDKFPKWLNPKTSLLYDKSGFWYGMFKAKSEIIKTGEAWIVEGYNDVIAFQTNGLLNTVASSGTSITEEQAKLLRKHCSKVVLCLDGDSAGIKAMIKHIALFIKHDFRVFVKLIENGLDPDEYVRREEFNQENFINDFIMAKEDGFKFLMQSEFKDKDEIEKSSKTRELLEIVCNISDEGMKTIYMDWLAKESSVSKTNINKWTKEIEDLKNIDVAKSATIRYLEDSRYVLPKEVTEPLSKFKETIEKYQMFQSNGKVWILTPAENPPYTFHAVTNFEIRIVQHMQDEKFPKKLIWLKNTYGREVIFDVLSSEINSPQSFENMVTNQGKYYWTGNRKDHNILKIYLFESMGTGRMIEVLGWQPEGFWAWNNKISIPATQKETAKTIELDTNGVFIHNDISYYIPSANKAYAHNRNRFEAQKKVVSKETKNTFLGYTSQMMKVHRHHGMMGILFTVASMFQDIVESELGSFPMLFLFGAPSSGKDQLADCCQSFFGRPQTAINLEAGVSTIKAQVREFAQFSNIISHLSEYKPGNPQLDGVLKGLWDRRGYKRGTIESNVSTESIPILSSVLMTGNFAPDQDALITRLIWEFMDKTTFTDDEVKEYELLADMTRNGISGITPSILAHRQTVVDNFKAKQREFKATLGARNKEANSRMIENLSVLGAFYQIFADILSFPFTMDEMLTHFNKTLDRQMKQLNSASLFNKFWECFLSSMRSGQINDQIRVERDFKIDGDYLFFNFTSAFNRVQRQWFSNYKENAPGKGQMSEQIKKDKCFLYAKDSVRMGEGRQCKNTSAYVIKLSELAIGEEIILNTEFQLQENRIINAKNKVWDPAMQPCDGENSNQNPLQPLKNEKNSGKTDELPF